MPFYGSDDVAFVLVGGYDLRPNATDFTHNTEAVLEETTVLGDSWQQQGYVGLRRHDLSINGFYDDAAKASVEALVGHEGTGRVVSYGIEGNTIGKNYVGLASGVQGNVSRVASRGALHKLNTQLQGSGALEQGKILFALSSTGAATGNTQAAPVDNGASSTGGAGVFHLSALTLDTATGLIAWVRHSSDNISYTNLLAFTRATSTAVVPGAERVETTGSVERYLAAAYEFGTTAAPGGATRSGTFMIGFARTADQ